LLCHLAPYYVRPNARPQLLPKAAARDERRLEGVGCRLMLGREAHLLRPHSQPCAAP
jgi:hypothetical protein